MKIPVIAGTIKRRFLINFRVDPAVMAGVLPAPFEPKLHEGWGIAGICLIRLEGVRPKNLPLPCGLASENAAHRFAVQWQGDGELRSGVYIPRRDTDSLLSHLAGGRIFPGVHHQAAFRVSRQEDAYRFEMSSADGNVHLAFEGHQAAEFPADSVFDSFEAASQFFEDGSLGYSDTRNASRYDGMLLQTEAWKAAPFQIDHVCSSYFDDESVFPKGSIVFDHALLMEDIPHEWHTADDLCCKEAV